MQTAFRALRPLCGSVLMAVFSLAGPASAVTIDWVSVGDPGNAADTTGYGAVAYGYKISKYEITNAQYSEFLNSVAATDTNGLYSTTMGLGYGGITRSGSPGSYSYSAISGRASMPVNNVSFWDILRFANWLHNGQPTGAQGNSTTEDGAYTLTAGGIAANTVARNAGATIFLTSENEWYKAAYYDAVSNLYYDYPAGTDLQTVCAAPTATGNRANCNNLVGNLTSVGSYTGSQSPNGTFDQGGNVYEWTEASAFSFRIVRGGAFTSPASYLVAAQRFANGPAGEWYDVGFRVASPLPEPGTCWLLATSVLSLAAWRRRHG